MDISEYLSSHDLTQRSFLNHLNTSRPKGTALVYPAAMSEYVNGKRSPSDSLKSQIRKLTDGLVDGNSWLDRKALTPPTKLISTSGKNIKTDKPVQTVKTNSLR